MTDIHLPFRDGRLPVAERVDDLLQRLTLDERIAMLHQFAPAVERLGVGAFRTGQEALHGVAWMGSATMFPQAVGLGATWNEELVRRVGEAVGTETRAMRARDPRVGLNVWAPTVNLLRHPLWGRNEEGYSEDPLLTSAVAVAYTRGLRGDHPVHWRTAPVLKHWLAHNNETDRDTCSSSVRPRVLHEYDLRAFRAAVQAGGVAGVMPSYNLVNGRPNHVSPLLSEELRNWTDRSLVVCSDAGAPSNLVDSERYYDTHEEATAAALRAGVDSFTDHGQDSSVMTGRVRAAHEQGLIDEKDIDRAVRRLLRMRFTLGEFDPGTGPYADAGAADFDTPGHRALARECAEQAVVLLKNDGLLPIAEGARVAVVGLLADECKLDWYSGTLIHRSTPLDGLRERFGAQNIVFAEGTDRVRLRCAAGWVRVPASPEPDRARAQAPGAEGALDPALLAGRTDLPPLTCSGESSDAASELAMADWGHGVLTFRAPDGRYLSVAEDGFLRASADQPGGWVVQETFRLRQHGTGHLLEHIGTGRYVSVAADGLKVADIGDVFHVEVTERGEDAVAAAAAGADVVVVVAGNDPHINGRETEDRQTLALPDHQERLWRAALAANARTALMLVSSYPYAVADAHAALPALLWTAHGGQAAGTALARVLAGDVSPAGRLPQTWYAADADLPELLDYDIIGSGQTYMYFRGTPLYPFGHGLSYASFRYGDLTAVAEGDTVRVSLTVTNTGTVTADEVVQLYTRALDCAVPCPSRRLAAHRRISYAPGAARRVEFEVPVRELGFWDVARGRWSVTAGRYEFLAGASSADIRLGATVEIAGEASAPRTVVGRPVEAADYDEQRGTLIVDRTRASGDAVTPAGDGTPGELVFRRCDLERAGSVSVEVSATGRGAVELRLADGTVLAAFDVPATEGMYDYVTSVRGLSQPGPAGSGPYDLHVELRGPVRLARLVFSA
ncbi:glycoside hydrolase family 3 C-terminal domain-containing protein [Streptomyces sp. NPDC048389]|uniref:glycoside hydrolase family 3 C-terminal domain-containing protein n=1 Tax=Streptomyces sp. NPDC048389 TaxID=3154622 RepID=UPI0034517012